MPRLGLIAGTVFYGSDLFARASREIVDTPYGPALVMVTAQAAYIPRHGLDPEDYILPHRINYPANMAAFKQLGVARIMGVNSSGSLKASLGPGTIIAPHDYIALSQPDTAALSNCQHITPVMSQPLREKLLSAAEAAGVTVEDGGIYWQSTGPRLETRAEINFIRHFADVVGMTMASEATVAQELGLEYASICSVDNYAHGLEAQVVTEERIKAAAQSNASAMLAIFQALVDDRE